MQGLFPTFSLCATPSSSTSFSRRALQLLLLRRRPLGCLPRLLHLCLKLQEPCCLRFVLGPQLGHRSVRCLTVMLRAAGVSALVACSAVWQSAISLLAALTCATAALPGSHLRHGSPSRLSPAPRQPFPALTCASGFILKCSTRTEERFTSPRPSFSWGERRGE